MELFVAYYSGGKYEMEAFKLRITGPYWWAYVAMMFCNVIAPQAFWFKSCRENLWVVMGVCMLVNIGMWFERFVIIVTTLPRMWLPGDWKYYFLPCINIAEVKWTLLESDAHYDDKQAHPDEGIETEAAYQYEIDAKGNHRNMEC